MLDCTIKRKPRQSKIKRIVIDRSLPQNNRSNSADRDKIELVDNGNNYINIIVENKTDIVDSEIRDYIIAEIIVKEEDLNKNLRIINSSEEIKEFEKENYAKYDNEEEIKNFKI